MPLDKYCTVEQVRDKFIKDLPAKFTYIYIENIIKVISKYITRALGGKGWLTLDDVPVDIQDATAWFTASEIAMVIFPETPETSKNMAETAERKLKLYKAELMGEIYD